MQKMRSVFLGLLALSIMVAGVVTASVAYAQQATIIIVVRHADRDNLTIDELNATGIERAEALVTALEGMSLDAIYTIDRVRNRDTAAPLAAARGLEPIIVGTLAMTDSLLNGNAGKTVIWIGNTGNIANLWEDLDASGHAPTRYGDLFIVTKGNGRTQVERRHFGP